MLRVSARSAHGCSARSRISSTACSSRSRGTRDGSPKHIRIIARTLCSGVIPAIRRSASAGTPGQQQQQQRPAERRRHPVDRHGRRDQRQGGDEVGTAGGDQHADQPAEGVAEQVHRPALAPSPGLRRRCAPGRRRRPARGRGSSTARAAVAASGRSRAGRAPSRRSGRRAARPGRSSSSRPRPGRARRAPARAGASAGSRPVDRAGPRRVPDEDLAAARPALLPGHGGQQRAGRGQGVVDRTAAAVGSPDAGRARTSHSTVIRRSARCGARTRR